MFWAEPKKTTIARGESPRNERAKFGLNLSKKKKEKKPMLVSNKMTGVSKAVNVHPHLRIAFPETNKELIVAIRPITETI